jgi:peptidoglycan glycosyltransferase
MTRTTESVLLGLAVLLTAGGAALVTSASGDGVTTDVVVTPASFAVAFGGVAIAVRRWAPRAVAHLLPAVALLAAVGWIEVFRIDRDLGRLQRAWLVAGAAGAVFVLWFLRERGTEFLRRFRYLFLTAALGLLMLPLLPDDWPLRGVEIGGSRLWLRLELGAGSLSFQPGEAAKLLLVVFLAAYLADRRRALTDMRRSIGPLRLPEPRQLVPVLLAFGLGFAVLVYQRDLGASLLVFAVFAVMLYVATARPAYLVAGGLLVAAGGAAAYLTFDHVQRRVTAWLHPFDDFVGAGFQTAQGLFALGSGGVTGTGIGGGRPGSIPAAATDYVFAAVAEEMGLAGGLAVLVGFAVVVVAGFGIAVRARDPFRSLLAAGLTLTLGIQTVLIVSGVVRLLPVTGITLPFMSY